MSGSSLEGSRRAVATDMEGAEPPLVDILNVGVHVTSYDDATRRILDWGRAGKAAYVCVCNVHMVMEAVDDPEMMEIVNGADLVTPDGMPLVWFLRAGGFSSATRVYGPDLALALCARAARERVSVGLLGSRDEVREAFAQRLCAHAPGLEIGFSASPPFRPLSREEQAALVEEIRVSGVGVLLVGLGCPKQERWMAAHRHLLPIPTVGVGAAFDLLGGAKAHAPAFLQNAGLEWLFRLVLEPRRLWRRYLLLNPRFAVRALAQLARTGRKRGRE